MSKDPTIGMFVGDEEIERRQLKRLATPPPETPVAEETLEQIAEGCAPHHLFHMGAAATKEARAKLVANILSALRNERERCARVAANAAAERCRHHAREGRGVCGTEIAEAIRNG